MPIDKFVVLSQGMNCFAKVVSCGGFSASGAAPMPTTNQVKGISPIPFLLFHKASVLREVHSFIISFANAGLMISEIQTLWP